MSKGQEDLFCIGVFVKALPLRAEYVRDYKKLFLDAIGWYTVKQIRDDKTIESMISDKEYSLLVELKERVENEDNIPDRPLTALLEAVLSEYRVCLMQLKEKPWIRRAHIDEYLQEMRVLSEELLEIK